jgi:hypothetical protein
MYSEQTLKISEETLEDETSWLINYGVETVKKYQTLEEGKLFSDL